MVDFWVDVLDAADNVLGVGPLVNLPRASATRRLDGAGEITLSMFAGDKRVADLVSNERRVVLYSRAPTSQADVTLGSTIYAQLGIGTSGAEVRWKAQSFTMPFDGYLVEFAISFGSNSGSPTGTMTYEIREDNSGDPAAGILLSGAWTPTMIPSENVVTVSRRVRLTKGTIYWLVLRPTTLQIDPRQWRPYWTTDGAGEFAGGNASFSTDGGSTWTANGRDIIGSLTLYGMTEDVGPKRELGRGIVRKIEGTDTAGQLPLKLTGPDILDELRNVNCLLSRVYDGANVADVVDELVALASGWTVDTTGVTGTVYARFDGASVLKALQNLAKYKGYHLRLTGNRTLKFGALGDDSGLRVIQAGSHITPELEDEAGLLLIDRLRWIHDSEAIANWIVPVGRSRDETALTLQHSTRGGLVSNISYDDDNADSAVLLQGPTGPTSATSIVATGVANVVGTSSGTKYWQAQSFQVTAGKLTQIQISMSASSVVGDPVGNVIWQVCADSSGAPGTILASGNWTPTPSALNTIMVKNGPSLSASTTYWLVLLPTQPQSENVWWSWQTSTTSAYANGQLKYTTDGGTTWTNTTQDAYCIITTGSTTPNTLLAQSFVADGSAIPKVDLWLSKEGSPTDGLTLEIQPDSSGAPSGTAMTGGTSGEVNAAILPSDADRVTFCFTSEPVPTNGNTYWLVLSTDGSQSSTDYVQWHADASSPSFANGEMKSYSSSSWNAESKDACFDIFKRASHSDPYAVLVKPGAHGRATYYLKDATSVSTYGQIERVFTVDITPFTDGNTDAVSAANAVYDVAAVWLGRYGTRQTVYRLKVRKGYQTVYPGQTVRLVYKGFVYDEDDNKVTWLDIDDDFWVTQVKEAVGRGGLSLTLEISNVERAYEDAATQLVRIMEQVELANAAPRAYSLVQTTSFTEFVENYFNALQ